MNTPRKRVAIAALAVAALGLSACSGGDSGNADGSETIMAVVWPGPEGDAMEAVAKEYNEGQGKKDKVQVKTVLLGREDTFNKEATEMATKSSEFDVYWTASYILEQHAAYLEPLNDVNLDAFMPKAVDALTIDDNVYGLPLDVSMHYLMYREDLVSALLDDESAWDTFGDISEKVVGERLEPKDPNEWTWDDYNATAAYFTQTLNPDSPTEFGTALAGKNTPFNAMFWDNVLWGSGGQWLDGSDAVLDSHAAEKAMEIYQTAYDNKLVPPGSVQGDFNELQASMQSGSIALMQQWAAGYETLNDPEQSPKTAGKLALAPVPGQKAHVHFLAAGLNKFSEKKDAANKWLSYLGTEGAQQSYAEAGGIPSVADVLTKQAENNQVLGHLAEDVDKYGYVEERFNKATQYQGFVALGNALSAGWVGNESIDAALKAAQEAMSELAEK
ncbi:extracellular solute-binding protein [Paramicrobacterium chengjingii]|uniref:Extracellular solute-binding protein n=1 Tax=Paramicrobacterium chengjingii TaxID=2769067 RepID=A0ABX6YHK7_9MICO|nr:extracellular solute-binding protein [Microbacterium chengjingii]QPZ38247.1 extracellular solute-binding protein [Microbacterium chengjingii]